MGSEENKVPSTESKKNKEKAKKHHEKKSIGWIIGVVVLILISITFILPTTIFSGSGAGDLVFGKFNGKDIAYTDTYFQAQLNAALSQNQGQGDPMQMEYTALNQAFMGTAFNIAAGEMASDAGYKVTDYVVDQGIVRSGYFNDENGVPDIERYNSTSDYEKSMLRNTVESELPMQAVITDYASVRPSGSERDFVTKLASISRGFEYVYINPSAYPDDAASLYATENADRFQCMDLSIITLPTESEASAVINEINDGTSTFESIASERSVDEFASASGEMGTLMLYELEGRLNDSQNAVTIYSSDTVGALSGPYATSSGYSVFRINSLSTPVDMADEAMSEKVKTYIARNSSDEMNAFLDESAKTFSDRVSGGEDFYDVAFDMGFEVIDVTATNANPYNFPLLSNFVQTDPMGGLAMATSSDSDYYNLLFQSEEGTVLPAEIAGDGRVIAKVGATSDGTASTTLVDTMYPYLVQQMTVMDLQNSVFDSPLFENNFMEVFFSRMLNTVSV